jgi:sterol desaturase/sphingolipid hydroxylase (fatty acid hydroxylase superfamily)
MVPLVWVPVVVGLGAWSLAHLPWPACVALYAAGWFVWTFTEYTLHRFLFHWVPRASWGPRFHFILHGVHHEWVEDRYRLVMPPAAAAALAVIFFALWWTLLGPWGIPFFAGKVSGYIGYDMTHYYVHHGRVSGRIMKRLRAHHMNHHHNKDGRKFGVSTTLWDHVFRTN